MSKRASTMPVLAPTVLAVAGLLAGSPSWASAATPAGAAVWKINTVAGGLGVGPARQINSRANCAVESAGGYLYATEGGFVRRISVSTGYMDTPIIGTGDVGNGIPANQISLGFSCGLAVDAHGNVIFADSSYYSYGGEGSGRNVVRVEAVTSGTFYGQAMKAGDVYTIAGNGTTGYSGDGGPALDAELNAPGGVAVDPAGNVVVADSANDVVRVIATATGTFYGQAMTAGDIYTIAGDGTSGSTGDGGPATAAELNLVPFFDGQAQDSEPFPVVQVDQHGNVVLGDVNNGVIRVIAGSTGTFYGQAMTAGDIYQVASGFGTVSGIALDHLGNILVSDQNSLQVQVVAATSGTFYGQKMTAGHVYVVAGNGQEGWTGAGGPATNAEFSEPLGLSVDSAGNVIVADGVSYGTYFGYFDNELLRVVAERTGSYYGVAMKAGDIYTISGSQRRYDYGDGVPATSALLSNSGPADPGIPTGTVVAGRNGSFILTDTANQKIRMVAAASGTFYGRKMVAGDIYTIAGKGAPGLSGNNGPARKAKLNLPVGITLDRSGNVLFTDRNNDQVRVIASKTGRFYGQAMKAGDIYAIAGTGTAGFSGDGGLATKARLDLPYGIALDHSGNVVITDEYNGRVRVIATRTGRFYGQAMKASHIYTVAHLSCDGVAVDASGNLVLSDQYRIRVVAEQPGTFYGQKMKAGQTYLVAGVGLSGPVGDGGPATAAFITPAGITVDAAGNILIGDGNGGRLRVVAAKSGTFYGQVMKTGDIYTIAGPGTGPNPGGNGIPAIQAALSGPAGVAVTPTGRILISVSGMIREIAP